jgi:hypothetical protein
MRIRSFEQERIDAMDNAGPNSANEDQAENEFYKRAAGLHGA